MEITLSEIRDLICPASSDGGVWEIGASYLIRTVTMIQVGRLVSVTDKELVLSDAAWIADTGRFHDCLKDPENIKAAEPFLNDCIVGRGSIVDATKWHRTKVSQK